jgi:DNA-binding CsgD family transcriptional regulator/tetratricopeptide (TPR) repeat protein
VSSETVKSSGAPRPPASLHGRSIAETLLGREREMSELLAGLDDAFSGRGRLFLIGGEPGIGKSRLADELAAHARDRQATVLWGRCWEAGGAPAYWPWVQCLRSYLRGHDPEAVRAHLGGGATDIAQMLPEIEGMVPDLLPPPSVDPESARFRLFDSTTSFLRNAAIVKPLVIVIDDLQAADTPSLLLLRFLAGQLADTRIVLVGTYRDIELTPDHPLTGSISELSREPATHHLALGGLNRPDVGLLIQRKAQVSPSAGLVSEVHRQTNGNPLFVGEAITLLAAEGKLADGADAASLRLAIPSAVRDVIEKRLHHLGDPCRQMLTLASILGREVMTEALRRLGEMGDEELPDLLDEAASSSLLLEVPGAPGRFRFSHDLVREALYEEIPPARRAQLHLRAGEVLEALYAVDVEPHLGEIAHHFFQAMPTGDPARAAEYARRAGERAVRSLAYEEAARLYRMALEALELARAETDDDLRAELLVALGEAEARSGDLPGARETLLRAAEIARRMGAGSLLGRAALGYGGRFVWGRAGKDVHLIPILQDALVLLGGSDDRMRVRLLSRLAGALRDSREREHGASLARQAVDLARGLDDPATLAYALSAYIWAIWGPENPKERLELASELRRHAAEALDGERIVDGYIAAWGALSELGRMTESRAAVEEVARSADELRQPAQRWVGEAARAELLMLEGRFAEAEGLVASSLTADETTTVRDNVSAARFQLFLLRREQGRGAEIEAMLRSSVEEFPWYPLHRAALACLMVDLGGMVEARAVFDELAEYDFAVFHRDNEWVLGTSLAAEACYLLGNETAAAVLYDQLLPFRGRHAIGHAEGSVGAVDRYLGLLAATLGRLEEAERHFEDALEMNARMGARPWVAHTQHEYARMLAERGRGKDRDRAVSLLTSALETGEEIGMTVLGERVTGLLGQLGVRPRRPRPRPGAAATPTTLTPREREVAGLVAEGLSNRQIAEKLFVSERTAETHIQNILMKLGFTSRAQVAGWVVREGLLQDGT